MFNLNLSSLLKGFSVFRPSTQLEAKLSDINYPLEEYLKDEEAIQCYKDMKPNAKKYFNKDKIKQLIKYITVEPENDDYLKAHKYPYVASEMLKSECNLIQDLFVLTEEEYNEKYKPEEKKELNINTSDTNKNEVNELLENAPIEIIPTNKLKNKDNNIDNSNNREEKKLEDKKEEVINDKKEDNKLEIKEKKEEIKIDSQNSKENINEIKNSENIKKENNNKEGISNQKEDKKNEIQEEKKMDIKKEEPCNEIKEINKEEKGIKIKENKDNNTTTNNEEKPENKIIEENNIKIEEDKKIDKNSNENNDIVSPNEFLDLLLNFVITEKSELNDVLCGYFSNVLITLIDKYPSKLLIYLYTIRKDALKQIIFHSYQKSLSILTLKLLKIENLFGSIITEVKKNPNKINYNALLKKIEESYLYRNKLIDEIILSLNLDGFKNQKGEIVNNVDLESIFSILFELVEEKNVLSDILYNEPVYTSIFQILKTRVFTKENNDKNKQYIYRFFLILITKIFTNMNKMKDTFDFTKDINLKIDFLSKGENKPKTFYEIFIEVFLIIIIHNFVDNSFINGSNSPHEIGWGLGLHNIYIMDLVYEMFIYMTSLPLVFDTMIIQTKFINKCIDYFFKYQLNNIYHCKFIKLFKLILENESNHPELIKLLFNEMKFHEVLAEFVNEKEIKIIKVKDKLIQTDNTNEYNNYINKFYYKSGKTILSCMFPFAVDLIYKIQHKSGLKIFDEKEKNDLNIKNIGEFEFIKDENSSNNIVLIQISAKLREILQSSTIWCNIFDTKILPLIKKYESKLCPQKEITNSSSAKNAMNNSLMRSLINIIAKNPKLIQVKEATEKTNEKYNDVNFWEAKPNISSELKTKIKNNQENINNIKDNIELNNNINKEEENDNKNEIIDEEDELLGIAMKLEQKEKSEKFKSNLKSNKLSIISNNNNINIHKNLGNIKNYSAAPDLKATQQIKSQFVQNKDLKENNSKYNDTNFWQTKPESLLNKNEMDNILLDL